MRGGTGNKYEQPSIPIYDGNKDVLKEAFPDWENYCSENELREGGEYFNCNDGFFNISVMEGSIEIYISNLIMSCLIDGINSQCY